MPRHSIASWNGYGEPKTYTNGHVYLFDDIDPCAPVKLLAGLPKIDRHTYSCNIMRKLWEEHSDYKIHSVRFAPGTRKSQVMKFWQEEMKAKKSDDLVIVYYHGKAGNEEDEYKWRFSQYPKGEINAHKIIKLANDSKADCLFLLDCFIHTRITEKWKPPYNGTTEIIARPEAMCDSDGRTVEHDYDFTLAMVECLETYVEQIDKAFKKHRALTTIPHILARCVQMYSNPIRIWMDHTSYGEKKPILRLKLDPSELRLTGKLRFKAARLTLPPDGSEPEPEVEPEVDEGFVSDSDSEKDGDEDMEDLS